ncbi:GDSL-type esterase/lipase family protein [Texcoconibacillus texcoconensis]|uniref:Lysophospholipase L1-like esterase n=1 Tax=Texcoconibacillus texcoconensis TaxID=1095777 RepID=A0A840QQT6_9BACI|nr:GDSL-type esterase/lipase family protein [Texcoconibacillus texcoconensis]MBB5173709.1 lysophospholipase L1-like esterase [Texcoconibacillus texcoconensis]
MKPTFTYTAIGDSLTHGSGTLFGRGFTKPYAQQLEKIYRKPVITRVHAKPGITSGELLHLIQNPNVQKDLYHADLITVTIGGNDALQAHRHFLTNYDPQIYKQALNQLRKNLDYLLSQIRSLKISQPFYIIQLVGLYNPYPHLPYSDKLVNDFNLVIRSFTYQNMIYIDLHTPFSHMNSRNLLIGVHPNRKGYRVISSHLVQSLYQLS